MRRRYNQRAADGERKMNKRRWEWRQGRNVITQKPKKRTSRTDHNDASIGLAWDGGWSSFAVAFTEIFKENSSTIGMARLLHQATGKPYVRMAMTAQRCPEPTHKITCERKKETQGTWLSGGRVKGVSAFWPLLIGERTGLNWIGPIGERRRTETRRWNEVNTHRKRGKDTVVVGREKTQEKEFKERGRGDI